MLRARTGGPAERFARRLGGRHPVAVFAAALLLGFAALAAVSIALGLLVTDVLVHTAGIGSADERFVHTLAAHRTGFETDASSVGSTMGGAPVLPIVAALVAIGAAIARHWRIAAFAVFVLALESATYRVTTLAIHRDRPHVHRLEGLPADASFPSGHTAASIAVYAGLVLLLTSRIRSRPTRVRRVGRRRILLPCSSRCRGCTGACTTRSTSPAARVIGVARDRASCSSPAGPRAAAERSRSPSRAGARGVPATQAA